MDDAAFCPTERKILLAHLQSQQHFNWFRLDSDGAHKVHKCTSNISLCCGFKELSVKGLKKHCVLHIVVSYLNKGLPSSYLGRENNNTILVQNVTREEDSFSFRYTKVLRACYCSIVVLMQILT